LFTEYLQSIGINEQYPVYLIYEIIPLNPIKVVHLDIYAVALCLTLFALTFLAGITLGLKRGGSLS
jgi:hypothetical protein